jgi:hypothetical protein
LANAQKHVEAEKERTPEIKRLKPPMVEKNALDFQLLWIFATLINVQVTNGLSTNLNDQSIAV